MNMTEAGKYEVHTPVMDLIELARTIQADKERAIASETRRRRLTEAATPRLPGATTTQRSEHDGRPLGRPQRPSASGLPSR